MCPGDVSVDMVTTVVESSNYHWAGARGPDLFDQT